MNYGLFHRVGERQSSQRFLNVKLEDSLGSFQLYGSTN